MRARWWTCVFFVTGISPAPASADAGLDEAVARVRAAEEASALAVIRAMPAAAQARLEVRYLEARLLERVGRLGDAEQRLRSLDVASLPSALRAPTRFRHARLAARTGHCELAVPALESLLRDDQFAAASRGLLAECALVRGDAAAALAHIDENAAASERAVDVLALANLAADALVRLGRVEHAATRLREAYLAHPAHPDARLVLARLAALDARAAAFSLDERLAIAAKLVRARAHAEALTTIDATPASDERARGRLARARGEALFAARRYAEAVVAFDAAVRANGVADRDSRFLAARAAMRAGDGDDAVARFDEFAARYPDDPRVVEAKFLAASIRLDVRDDARMRALVAGETSRAARDRRAAGAFTLALAALAADDRAGARTFLAIACARPRDEADALSCRYHGAVASVDVDAEASKRALRELASGDPHGFYGLLARNRLAALGEPFVVPPPGPAPREVDPIVLPDEVRFLASLGLVDDAAAALAEYERAYRARPGGARALVTTYLALDDPGRAFRVAGDSLEAADDADRPVFEAARQPTPFEDVVRPLAASVGVDPFYVYATMRVESGFRADAVSRVGALGILQMMPTTAARAAGLPDEAAFDPRELFSPRASIRLALVEIRDLHRRYRGCIPLVAAAYNAGPQKVDAWLEQRGNYPIDLFLEAIPFDETRRYARRVTSGIAGYHARAGDAGHGPGLVEGCPGILPRMR